MHAIEGHIHQVGVDVMRGEGHLRATPTNILNLAGNDGTSTFHLCLQRPLASNRRVH